LRAFQVTEFGAPLESRVLPDPQPGAQGVVVDVASCGLCHTDAHLQQGHLSLGGDQKMLVAMLGTQAPVTLGHEIYGHVAAFGQESGLTPADIGRPVVVYPWIGCGHCEACLADRDNECPTPEMLGTQRPGGHGEKVVIRDPKFLMDAKGLDSDYAGIFACSGLTAYVALGAPRRSYRHHRHGRSWPDLNLLDSWASPRWLGYWAALASRPLFVISPVMPTTSALVNSMPQL
jgi:propanol-preferring alcohol dehydrogenase